MCEMIKRAIQMGNLRYKIFCFFAYLLGFSNHEIHELEVRNKVLNTFEKKYGKLIESNNVFTNAKTEENKTVWVCWLQGYNNAPEIVKSCVESIKYWLTGYNLILIDENNLFDYIDLPDYVVMKWKKGIISNTLFSDFIRLSVLEQYGGIWIDSTVYFTGSLPKYIERKNFFMYRCNIYDIAKFGESWLIKAEPNNFIIKETLKLMCEYWKNETKIKDYFQMFIFMRMVINKNKNFINQMPIIPSAIPHMLQGYLNEPFDMEIFKDICLITNIHKLTYKDLNKNENTFSSFIIKNRYKEI